MKKYKLLVETRFIASLTNNVLQLLIEMVFVAPGAVSVVTGAVYLVMGVVFVAPGAV